MLGAGEVVDLKFLSRSEKTRINQKMTRGKGTSPDEFKCWTPSSRRVQKTTGNS